MTKKQQAEFKRCYHSKERVEWIKSLPSVASGASDSAFNQIDNVHVKGGIVRKADYTWIVPLRRTEHITLHQHPSEFFEQYGVDLIQKAVETEAAWQDFVHNQCGKDVGPMHKGARIHFPVE